MPNFLVTDRAGGNLRLALADGGELPVQPGAGTGAGVTVVTATAPITSTGGTSPNIAATNPSRVYGRGSAATLTNSPQIIADGALVPSNTGKLQISVWTIVANSSPDVVRQFVPAIVDGSSNLLWNGTPVSVAAGSSAAFAVTIDSDLPTGGSATPHTYTLGVTATINFTLAELSASSGFLTTSDGSSGILIKENFN